MPRAYIFAGKAAPGYEMAKLHIRLLNDVAAVINADPDVQRQAGGGVRPQLRRLAGAGDHPGGRPLGADLDGGQGGLGDQQHEVRAQRRAHPRHARRRQRRDPRRRRPRELLPVRPAPPTRWRATRATATTRATSSRRTPALDEALALIESGFFSLGEPRSLPPDRRQPALATIRYMVCADFDAYVATRGARRPPPTATARDWSRRALPTSRGPAASPATPPSASTPRRSGASSRSARTSRCSSCRSSSAVRGRARAARGPRR